MTTSTSAHVAAKISLSQLGVLVGALKAQALGLVPGSDRVATQLESALAQVLAAHRQGPTEMLKAKAAVLVLESGKADRVE
jgi:hypothetical protein